MVVGRGRRGRRTRCGSNSPEREARRRRAAQSCKVGFSAFAGILEEIDPGFLGASWIIQARRATLGETDDVGSRHSELS